MDFKVVVVILLEFLFGSSLLAILWYLYLHRFGYVFQDENFNIPDQTVAGVMIKLITKLVATYLATKFGQLGYYIFSSLALNLIQRFLPRIFNMRIEQREQNNTTSFVLNKDKPNDCNKNA